MPQARPQDNSYRDNTPDSLDLAKTARPVAGSSRKGGNPVLFLVGDSTTRTGTRGNGDNGQWGWGYYASQWFDEDRITVENHALGGLSCRTFYRDWWPDVIKGVQKGDWVIIQIGHNDSGPYDQPGGRSSIPGTGAETVQVTLRDGRVETVRSYGEYLRRYIDEVRAKGATPLLSTLTPRNQWDDGKVRRKNDSYNIWIREVADEKHVPVIGLEEISARDFESWSRFKVDYMFYNDNIHSSAYGAAHNAWCMARGIAALPDCGLKACLKPLDPPQQEFTREPGKPALIVTGDSTIQNTDSDPDGMWGWGSVLETVFDPSRITLVNAGKAGRSARTFLNEGRWDKVYNSIRPGDFVVIQFGHNDMGRVGAPPYRAELAGDTDESDVVFMANTRQYEVVRSYGWYLRKFIDDVREKGGIPILVSLTPRNEWPHGRMERRDDTYGIWVRDVIRKTGVDFVDMHNITADWFDSIGPEAAKAYYKNDHTHTSRLGAERNAKSFAEGLRKLGHPLANYLK
ncbi:MAG: rhamnogalacturonan acetylesterase [Bacteroidales bacterium]|nr:rhamnogalacturonan acetylesterase [Bacteroidales bacterium]